LTRTFQPPQSGKTASTFCTTYKIITGAHLGKLLDEVAGGWWTNRNAIYWLVYYCYFFGVESIYAQFAYYHQVIIGCLAWIRTMTK